MQFVAILVNEYFFEVIFMFNEFKSKSITLSDYFIHLLTAISLMFIPGILSFNYIIDNVLNLVAFIVSVFGFILSGILLYVRLKHYIKQ